MRSICLIGDIHGQLFSYFQIVNNLKINSIQLGDMGIGFERSRYDKTFNVSKKHKFIRGNHDNPEVCRNHTHYLGDYGITKDGLFYVSGANSIDKEYRTVGIDWWDEEEFSINEFNQILELYEKEKPEFVITHSQPNEFIDQIFTTRYKSRTQDYFSEMFKIHQPKKWISAHLHCDKKINIQTTEFICVNSLNYYILEI